VGGAGGGEEGQGSSEGFGFEALSPDAVRALQEEEMRHSLVADTMGYQVTAL
jgi:hypothetical protein